LFNNPLVQEGACLRMQRWWRALVVIWRRTLHVAILTQRHWRGFHTRKWFVQWKKGIKQERYDAATNIQHVLRGKRSRKIHKEKIRMEKIQAREDISKKKRNLIEAKRQRKIQGLIDHQKTLKASKIQRAYRDWLKRKPPPPPPTPPSPREKKKYIAGMESVGKWKRDANTKHELTVAKRHRKRDAKREIKNLGLKGDLKKAALAKAEFDEEEIESAVYSVIHRQNIVMRQAGVVDLWITVGEDDAEKFWQGQAQRKNMGETVFHKLDVDLHASPIQLSTRAGWEVEKSALAETTLGGGGKPAPEAGSKPPSGTRKKGNAPLSPVAGATPEARALARREANKKKKKVQQPSRHVYLWVSHGHGERVLTQIELKKRGQGSKLTMRDHKKKIEKKGFYVRWQESGKATCMLEIWFKNKARLADAIPIKNIAITKTKAEENKLRKRRGFTVLEPGGLEHFGMDKGTKLWAQRLDPRRTWALKRYREEVGHKCEDWGCGPDSAWPDVVEKVRSAIDFCALSTDNICEIRRQFDEIDVDGSGAVDVQEFFLWLGEPRTEWGDEYFALADADKSGLIDFGEFVHVITIISMMEQPQLYHFLFSLLDRDDSGGVSKEEFCTGLKRMVRDNPLVSGGQMVRLADAWFGEPAILRQGGRINFPQFHKLMLSLPSVSLPIFKLKDVIADKSLGQPFWAHKKEIFAQARSELQDDEDKEQWIPPPRFDGKKTKTDEVDVTKSKNMDQQEYLASLEARKRKVAEPKDKGMTPALAMLAA